MSNFTDYCKQLGLSLDARHDHLKQYEYFESLGIGEIRNYHINSFREGSSAKFENLWLFTDKFCIEIIETQSDHAIIIYNKDDITRVKFIPSHFHHQKFDQLENLTIELSLSTGDILKFNAFYDNCPNLLDCMKTHFLS